MPILLAALLMLSQPASPSMATKAAQEDPKKAAGKDPKKATADDLKKATADDPKKASGKKSTKSAQEDPKKAAGKKSKKATAEDPKKAAGKDAKKEKGKGKDVEKAQKPSAPEWKRSDTPYGNFLAAARQMPDFTHFPAATDSIGVTVAAGAGKGLVFLDSVQARKTRSGFKVTGGNAVPVGDKDLVSKLVMGGADTTPDPESARHLNETLTVLRKAKKVEALSPAFLEAASVNKKAYRINDDVAADVKACGDKRYFAALSTLPEAAFIGPDAVVVELEYTVQDSARSFKVRVSAARLKEGWRVGGLRVTCY